MSKQMLELADRITNHLVTLASTNMKLSLTEWVIISNDILSAVATLRSSADSAVAIRKPVFKPPFEVYHNGNEIGDTNGHVCTAEDEEIAQALVLALNATSLNRRQRDRSQLRTQ